MNMSMTMSLNLNAAVWCLLALAPLSACEIGSKSVGMETESGDDDSGDDGSGDGADGGQTSMPTSASASGGSSADDGGDDGSSGGGCGEPPPIELAPCVACDPQQGAYTNAACVTDCGGEACGEPCLRCPDDAPGCLTAEYAGMCDAAGQCIAPAGPDLCMNALGPGFETELTEQSGCSDLYVHASNPEDTLGLVLSVDAGLVAAVVEADTPMSTELDITDASVSFRVQTGIAVTELECNDAISMRPVIDETWSATAGTVTLDLIPDGNGYATADITLEGVTIERTSPAGGPAPIDIPTYVFTDVAVGWLPG